MLSRDFSYELPDDLIAQYPAEKRDDSRLLYLDSESKLIDSQFNKLPDYLKTGDLIVLNDTRVIPARLYARKETGGKVEIMLERIQDDNTLLVQLKASKSPRQGMRLFVNDDLYFEVRGRHDDMFWLVYNGDIPLQQLFERLGHMPLPPYIDRDDEDLDQERYQTVFSKTPGAVAAPTAGLHFTAEILNRLKTKGVDQVCLTLHVGAGTFQPVRVDAVSEHRMHSEYMCLSRDVVNRINQTRENGGRILAVGTTVVRGLEAAAEGGKLKPYAGDTDIFIYPGFRFNVVDLLLTNFHLPESSLLMLVCAFAGQADVLHAYQHAIKENYRFYSYGDAMLLSKKDAV